MPQLETKTTIRQVLRALLPSPLSAAGCFVTAIIIVFSQVLYISLEYGTILPGVFDGELATVYTNYVVSPVSQLLHTEYTGHLAAVVVWALAGLLLYELVVYAFRELQEWRQASEKQVFFQPRGLIRRRLLGQLIAHVAWRTCVVSVGLASLWVIRVVLHYIYITETEITTSLPVAHLLWAILVAAALWMLILHWCLALLRLYLFRTRLLEDDDVYRT